jgi:hypothetical protein
MYLPWQAVQFLITLHPLLENVLQTANHFDISCLELHFHGWESSKIARGEILNIWRIFQAERRIQFRSRWVFPTMKTELLGKKFRSDQRYAERFREVCGALYEVHRLPREVLRKRDRHRTSTDFRLKVVR